MIYINGRFLINNPTGIENFAYGMCKAMLEKGIKFIILTPKSAIRSYDVIGFDMIKIGLFTGPLWEQIDEAFQFVLRNIHLGATIVGIYRQDVYEIPPDAIRELIINAMVHRSYLDHGTIQVAVYDNRLEITSPGKLPMGQTMERMKEGYSKIRNEALAHAFAYMNLIEHWGSGIPRIIDKVKAAGLREPEFIGGEVDLRICRYYGR